MKFVPHVFYDLIFWGRGEEALPWTTQMNSFVGYLLCLPRRLSSADCLVTTPQNWVLKKEMLTPRYIATMILDLDLLFHKEDGGGILFNLTTY